MSIPHSTQAQAQITRGYTDMKRINKTVSILKDTSGESIIEVLVAFILLSIMLVIFSQGLASASNSEVSAKQNRENADQSMIDLQRKLASSTPKEGAEERNIITVGSDTVKSYKYEVNGNTYIVFYSG